MRRYRTEIIIPADRSVVLQLPADLPEGRAVVIIQVEEPDPGEARPDEPDAELDREDIEWWEEFEAPEIEDPE